jgi:Pyridoxamine 5'-phosphate oxidase
MPTAELLEMPAAYGATTRAQPWSAVSARLAAAKQYWVATNRPGGSPHVVPVDGLWVDDALYYGGSPDTVHVRTALADPHVTIHLPDPWDVVIVEGTVELAKPSPELAAHLAGLANAKYPEYGITFDADSYRDPFVLRPRRALAWSSFPTDATRYRFES